MKYEKTTASLEAYKEVRAIMNRTGATKVTRRNGQIFLNNNSEPWDGQTGIKDVISERFERLKKAKSKLI